LGNTAKASNYSSIAASYVTQFQSLASDSASGTETHLTLSYNQDTTWGLTYNLFADKLLGLNVFPESVYALQTAWYANNINTYGVILDTRHTYTKSDWQILTASIVTSTATRDAMIAAEVGWASSGLNNAPLSDFYDTISGANQGFRARPVVGGHLALLVV